MSTPTPAPAPAPAPEPPAESPTAAGAVTLNDFTFDFGDTQVSTPVDPTAATLPAFDTPGSMRISDASPGGLSAALDPAPVAENGTNGGERNGSAAADEDDDAPRFDEDGNPLFDVPAPKTPSAGPKTSSVFGENVAAASGPIQLPPDLTRPDAGIAARGANDASEIAAVDDAIADALGEVDGDDADAEEVTPVPDAPLAPMPVAPPDASAASAARANAGGEPADASTAATVAGTPDAASRAAATAGTATLVTPATAPSAPRPASAGSTPAGESLPPAEQLRVTIAALGNDVRERDDIARVVLQYALSRYKRAALFVIKKEMLVGWEGGGSSLARSAVRGIMVPLTNPSIFKTVYETKVLYCGGVPHTTVNDIFFNALGDPRPERVIVVPFVLRDKVACVLYADGGDVDVETPDSIGELYQLGRAVSTAFEHLILRNKRS